jgi:serine O-acetyltransferase
VRVNGKKPEGPDADWMHLPDPVADAISALSARVRELEGQIAAMTGKPAEQRGEVRPLRGRGQDPAGG